VLLALNDTKTAIFVAGKKSTGADGGVTGEGIAVTMLKTSIWGMGIEEGRGCSPLG